jgi:hypothetical protein
MHTDAAKACTSWAADTQCGQLNQERPMPAMPHIANPWLLIAGLVLLILGVMLRRWASRHDLMSAVAGGVKSAAFDAVRTGGKSLKGNPLTDKLQQVAAEGSHAGKAKKVAGFAVRHFVAQVAGIAGLIGILGGLALAAAGAFWR